MANSLLQTDIDLTSIVFSDESRICLGPDSRFIWFQPGEVSDDVYMEYKKAEIGVMIWEAIGKDFKSQLMICPKILDAKGYRQLIKDSNMIETLNDQKGEGNWIYMQDGAPPHKARETQKFLLKRMNLLANWPANSPDLNPIEHLWAILKYRMSADNPKNSIELVRIIKDEWDKLPMTLINNLVLSFKKRLLLAEKKESK